MERKKRNHVSVLLILFIELSVTAAIFRLIGFAEKAAAYLTIAALVTGALFVSVLIFSRLSRLAGEEEPSAKKKGLILLLVMVTLLFIATYILDAYVFDLRSLIEI